MPVLVFLNQKGGVGKTTLATNVAAALSLQKLKVLFIDADQQGTVAGTSTGTPQSLTVYGLVSGKSNRLAARNLFRHDYCHNHLLKKEIGEK